MANETAARIAHLARRVDRLTVCRRDPEAFFIERSEIVFALRRLSREVAAAVAGRSDGRKLAREARRELKCLYLA